MKEESRNGNQKIIDESKGSQKSFLSIIVNHDRTKCR